MKWLHRICNFLAIAAPAATAVLAGPLSPITVVAALGTVAAKLAASPPWMPPPPPKGGE